MGMSAILVIVGFVVGSRCAYPYGSRSAYLPCVLQALRAYALEHEGAFPEVGSDPYASLQALYPRYTRPNLLSGLSGSKRSARDALRSGNTLTKDSCSWVYHPGFSVDDDERIAIIWESVSGVGFNGRATDGRAVGFIDGSMAQISEDQWDEFLIQQENLRDAALSKRSEKRLE